MKRMLLSVLVISLTMSVQAALGERIAINGYYMSIGDKPVVPAMGEVHYSRIPAGEWSAEVHKMKEGGITMIACYVFWNHIEELEGQYDWSGQRDLRAFLEVCKAEELPTVQDQIPIHGPVNEYNKAYLETKRDRMGHTL